MLRWTGLTQVSLGLLASQPALAAGNAALDKQAKKGCLSGDYLKGVSILAELFVDTGDATCLYYDTAAATSRTFATSRPQSASGNTCARQRS
jgi:hypothetical protein